MGQAVEGSPPVDCPADSLLLIDVIRAVLDRCGGQRWTVRPEETWCFVTPPASLTRGHGWKIHVSATPLSAPMVLARAGEVLVDAHCSFKFATDIPRVIQLNDVWYDRGGSGKFITVYPPDDDKFLVLLERLHEATTGLAGPQILSDKEYWPGSLVHFRYGEFVRNRVLTDDGILESRMVGPSGELVRDERRAWFTPPSWVVSPFADQPIVADSAPQSVLLHGRFRVRQAIRHANKGGVFRAVDERTGREVIIKQARAHVGAGLDGTDVRDRLREEARLLESLVPLGVAPALVTIFDEQGDVFLVEEMVPGSPLHIWAAERAAEGGCGLPDGLALARGLIELAGLVHDGGYVIRDLKPHNIILTPQGQVRLVDVEFVAEVGQLRFPIATLGYVAPEVAAHGPRRRGPVPGQSSDCYSLGVTIFCCLTGLAPTWVAGHPGSPRATPERELLLSHIGQDHPVLVEFAPMIVGLTEVDTAARWTLERAMKAVAEMPSAPRAMDTRDRCLLRPGSLERLTDALLAELMVTMTPDEPTLWRQARNGHGEPDACGAWNGAAGILAALTRAARADGNDRLRDTVARATGWIGARLFTVPRLLPGLCFGRAGTAWAAYDAARLIGDAALAAKAVELAVALPTRWPSADITHGLSGAGMAHLYLWQATGDSHVWERTVTLADAVVAAAHRDGQDWLWPIPSTLDSSTAGSKTFGFAHGVAGVGAFLLAASRVDGAAGNGERYLEAAIGAGGTLARAARVIDDAVSWPTSVGGDAHSDRRQWCGGPAGIGTFLIRLWDATGDATFADLAERCAVAATRNMWGMGVGSCCGLAGVGNFLLDMADITGRAAFRARAEHAAGVIDAQYTSATRLRVTTKDGADYANGPAGVLDFLVRLRLGGPPPWLPYFHKPDTTKGREHARGH